jgi:hypothetical protein
MHLDSQAVHFDWQVKYSSGKDRWLLGLSAPENLTFNDWKKETIIHLLISFKAFSQFQSG